MRTVGPQARLVVAEGGRPESRLRWNWGQHRQAQDVALLLSVSAHPGAPELEDRGASDPPGSAVEVVVGRRLQSVAYRGWLYYQSSGYPAGGGAAPSM